MSRPVDEDTVRQLAAVVGIEIPRPCLPGVAENLRLLMDHAAKLDDAELAR
jgi:hypothetical protein